MKTIDIYNYAENYIKNAGSYLIKYSGTFYGSKTIAGKEYRVAESISGKTKKHNCVYYSVLDVTKNLGSNFGGNVYVRSIMPDSALVLNQINTREKVFNESWTETLTNDFDLFLNRKGGKPYIKVNTNTHTSISHTGSKDGYELSIKLKPNDALAEYNKSIRAIFKIFIDDFSYNVRELELTATIDKYGRPKSFVYTLICNVSVEYKGIDVDIEGAKLTFTEDFSHFNGVNIIENEFVKSIG